jgi:hypothetical protein
MRATRQGAGSSAALAWAANRRSGTAVSQLSPLAAAHVLAFVVTDDVAELSAHAIRTSWTDAATPVDVVAHDVKYQKALRRRRLACDVSLN